MNDTEKLLKLRKDLDTAKEETTRLQARKEARLEELRALGFETVKEAEKEAAKLEKEAEKAEDRIHELLKKIEELGVWNAS